MKMVKDTKIGIKSNGLRYKILCIEKLCFQSNSIGLNPMLFDYALSGL